MQIAPSCRQNASGQLRLEAILRVHQSTANQGHEKCEKRYIGLSSMCCQGVSICPMTLSKGGQKRPTESKGPILPGDVTITSLTRTHNGLRRTSKVSATSTSHPPALNPGPHQTCCSRNSLGLSHEADKVRSQLRKTQSVQRRIFVMEPNTMEPNTAPAIHHALK